MQIDAQRIQAELGEIKEMLKGIQGAMERVAQIASQRIQTEHPHIVRIEGVCGGRPMIAGTRISVRTIVERTRLGDSPERIVEHYPPLTLAQVYDALSYYHEHKAELEAEIANNREALAWVTKRSSE